MLPNEDQKHDNEGKVGPANLDLQDEKTRQVIAELYRHERALHKQREEEARNDPLLRLCMVEMIHHLNELVMDYAGELALRRGDDGWFNMDRAAVDIMWMLAEFLTQAHYDRNDDPHDCYMNLAKHYQLTREHGADWFDVPMIMVEGVRGFVPGFHSDEFNSEEKPLTWSASS